MVNVKPFKLILQKTQKELKELLFNYLTKKDYTPTDGDGYLYAKGDIPILLVAHLDTVHREIPKDVFFDEEQMVMWSPTGIGGDDRCGVYLITQIINHGFRPHILFLEDEEKGCIGAGKCTKELEKPNVKFMVEIDRKGENDCVFYDCENKAFISYIETFGFEKAFGSFTDVCTLSKAWDIASVNLSSGYYNAHTNTEYIKLRELNQTYRRVIEILEDDNDEKPYYDYQPRVYKTYSYSKKKENENEEDADGIFDDWNDTGWSNKNFKEEHKYLCSWEGNIYYTDCWYDREGRKHQYAEDEDPKDLI